MKSRLAWLLACILASACAAPGSSDAPARSSRFAVVYVSVHAFGEARVGAALIDQEGRRTGWNLDRPIREIPGCGHEYGSEDGIPYDDVPEDATEPAPADTVPGGPQPMPIYHFFHIFQPILADSANQPGLLSVGGCELRLDPTAGGRVRLAIVGTGVELEQCQDTTSVAVRAGVPSRWWLSWRAADGKCMVAMSRMSSDPSTPVR
ncbi:MAG TPA: hypothetical protein VFV51_03880 [Vicinamibacterales bacterium]|nr:hypothetical protein [Vicinamibacterales bacterium]